MRNKIISLVKERDWVSFVELQKILGKNSEGQFEVVSPEHGNVVFWSGVSQEFSLTLEQLSRERVLCLHPTSVFTYVVDGQTLTLPVAKKFRSYKKPRWLPVCLRLVA